MAASAPVRPNGHCPITKTIPNFSCPVEARIPFIFPSGMPVFARPNRARVGGDEGWWTISATDDAGVPLRVMAPAICARLRTKLCSVLRCQAGGHAAKPVQ